MRYARASFLADWSGGPSALIFEPTDPHAHYPYSQSWSINLWRSAGCALQGRRRPAPRFTGGTVIVNPSPTTQQTLSLGLT